jgi:hypothetical protein
MASAKLDAIWQSLLGSQLIYLYYGIGFLGDYHRNKIYPKERVLRYLDMLEPMLREEKLLLSEVKPLSGAKGKELFRRIRGVVDFMISECSALRRYVNTQSAEDWKQFADFRQAAAEDIQYVLTHQGAKQRHSFKGGTRASKRHMGHYLGMDLVFGFFFAGLVADGYFRLLLPPETARQHIAMTVRLCQMSLAQKKKNLNAFPKESRPRLQQIGIGLASLITQLKALDEFIAKRKRSALAQYGQQRQQTWGYVQVMAAP